MLSQDSCIEATKKEVKGLGRQEVADHLSQTRKASPADTVHATLLSSEITLKFTEKSRSQILITDMWHHKTIVVFPVLAIFLMTSLSVAGADETCSRLPAVQTFRYRNCLPKTQLVFVCSGTCRSYTMTRRDNATTLQSSCTCCHGVEFVKARTQIVCPNADDTGFHPAVVEVSMPVRCMCRPCDFIPTVFLNPTNESPENAVRRLNVK